MTQSTTGLVEIKGCPICGGKATVNTRGRAEGVVCAQRDHRIQTYGRDGSAIERWNTRPTDPTIAELVVALEKARAEALEEAAQVCERSIDKAANEFWSGWSALKYIAATIRALPPTKSRSAL